MKVVKKIAIIVLSMVLICGTFMTGCTKKNDENTTSVTSSKSSSSSSSKEDKTQSSENSTSSETQVSSSLPETSEPTISQPTNSVSTPSSNVSSTDDATYPTVPLVKSGKNYLLTYVNGQVCKKETYYPAVAYMKDGKMADQMYESFIVLPYVSIIYSMSLNKKNWQSFINRNELRAGSDIDALNRAVGDMKKNLNKPDFMAEIYLTILPIRSDITDFGEVNGKNLNLSIPEDQLEALKWSVDEQIMSFNEKGYDNLKLCGFYWFDESIDKAKSLANTKGITDYIRSKGMVTTWIPYYKAQGYTDWKDFGFDFSFMQGNYFPANPTLPNAGGLDRLPSVTSLTESRGMGVCVEMDGVANEDDVSGLKQYLKQGCSIPGFMDRNVAYYTAGISAITTMANSKNSYIRSGYDDLYMFLIDKLVPQAIDIS